MKRLNLALLLTVALAGAIVQPAAAGVGDRLSITPSSVDFGVTWLGDTSDPQEFEITNTASQRTNTLDVSITARTPLAQFEFQVFSESCAGRSLAPRETCAVTVRHAPDLEGVHQATLAVQDPLRTSWAEAALQGEGAGLKGD